MSSEHSNQQPRPQDPRQSGAATVADRPSTMSAPGTGDLAEQPRGGQSTVSRSTEQGTTRIAESVVAKIAGLAARDIPGVYAMGAGMARRVGQLKAIIPGGDSSGSAAQGVSVQVGEREAAIDLDLVTWYGVSIMDISDAVRRHVVGQVEEMTGLRVVEVNIQVDDIHVETPEDRQSRGGQEQRASVDSQDQQRQHDDERPRVR
jgi:uncharacterized alkaline shock family protein YloU